MTRVFACCDRLQRCGVWCVRCVRVALARTFAVNALVQSCSDRESDTEWIRTLAGRAQWISSPSALPPGHSVMNTTGWGGVLVMANDECNYEIHYKRHAACNAARSGNELTWKARAANTH